MNFRTSTMPGMNRQVKYAVSLAITFVILTLLLNFNSGTKNAVSHEAIIDTMRCRPFNGVRFLPADQCWIKNGRSTAATKVNQHFRFPEEHRVRYALEDNRVQQGGAGLIQNGPLAALLARVQAANGVFGTVGEIGVHHGHYWLALALTARAGEKLFVADLFEQQDRNVDKSGKGDRQSFLEGLQAFGIDAEKEGVDIRAGLSYDLPMNYAKLTNQGFRLISVDGGHTAEIAYSDIDWAACNLVPGGIISVDDHWHPWWPAVTDAVYRYFACGQVELYPFLVVGAPNQKLYLTTKSHHEIYYKALLADKVFGPTFATKQSGGVDYTMNQVKSLFLPSCAPETGCAQQEMDKLRSYWSELMKT